MECGDEIAEKVETQRLQRSFRTPFGRKEEMKPVMFTSSKLEAYPKNRYKTALIQAVRKKLDQLDLEMKERMKKKTSKKCKPALNLADEQKDCKSLMIKDMDGVLHKFDVDSHDDIRFLRIKIEQRRLPKEERQMNKKIAKLKKSVEKHQLGGRSETGGPADADAGGVGGTGGKQKTRTVAGSRVTKVLDMSLPESKLFYLITTAGQVCNETLPLGKISGLNLRTDAEMIELVEGDMPAAVLNPMLHDSTLQVVSKSGRVAKSKVRFVRAVMLDRMFDCARLEMFAGCRIHVPLIQSVLADVMGSCL